MKTARWIPLLVLVLAIPTTALSGEDKSLFDRMQKAMQDGNYKDAYEGFRKLALDPATDPMHASDALRNATVCLQHLNRVAEIDAFQEAFIEVHKDDWRLLEAAAQNCMTIPHHGYMVAGKFQRGDQRGGGELVNAMERDRIRALQLMVRALPRAIQDRNAEFCFSLARILLNNRGHDEAWRLQYLSDLGSLPDYEPGWGYRRPSPGAPVDPDGKPIYHRAPESFEAAKTDGERWRWCLQEFMELSPQEKDRARMEFADFLHHQLDVQTLAHYGWRFGRMEEDDGRKDETGTYALHTLSEKETIARLASGARRFELPDEFNFIRIYREISDRGGSRATERLAGIFENRRQYPKAAEMWRKLIAQGPTTRWQDRLDQIVKNWGTFEPVEGQPAGRGATVEYRFRNGRSAEFAAREVKVGKLLDDVKAYLKKNPGRLDWQKVNLGDIGYRLVQEGQTEYLGDEVARWKLALEPRESHFDRRITVTTPLQKPGAYLLTAKMQDGNTSHIVLWLEDMVILQKPLDRKTLYFVADAVTGKPIPKANVEFFGYKQEHRTGNRYEVLTRQFAEFTDADGQTVPAPKDDQGGYQWLVIARAEGGRLAHLGFSWLWYGQRSVEEYDQTKFFAITDRPVYRPGQTVKFKVWVGRARYDQPDASEFAGAQFQIEIHDPKDQKVFDGAKKADAYGGIEGELQLASDAALGVYQLQIPNRPWIGGGSFRVEEYKKPEFEVSVDAPAEPILLGEKVEATIRARYYFGSPVTKARVKYKVLRTGSTERWFAPGPWDWLYGPGYWWYAYDYDWYPGFHAWGCRRPIPWWWGGWREPPEVVAESELEIGPDGTVKVEIDTALAKEIHPDQDHRYSITAEVVDASRRTIVGTGDVLVARKPFKVHAWVDRGYYRAGDTVAASFSARTLDSKPVQGKGELTLLKISYDKDGKPVETPVQTWKVDTDSQGMARQQIKATQAGQYRLSYKVTDQKNHTIEGGYLFTAIGEGFDGSQFRFNHIELVPEKREYLSGEKVKLQVNTDRAGSTVLLFLRPSNGIYLPPRVLRLDGKSALQEIEVSKKDMPNFFIEAVTVSGGKVHTEVREIYVPPETRVLSVGVKPSSDAYKPGEKARVKVQLAGLDGEPFAGSAVVSIYDKSVEYISGGSNVPAIKEFFWKWRRQHHPNTQHSLGKRFGNIVPKGAKGMAFVGIFGATSVDDLDGFGQAQGPGARTAKASGVGGGARLRAAADAAPAAPSAAVEAKAEGRAMADEEIGKGVGGPGGAEEVQPTVRKEFADTALWVGFLETGKDGIAEVELNMPENLTTWRIRVWSMGRGTRVGEGSADVVTRKNLILRLQAPRFFVERDEVVLSANVHNYLASAKQARAVLELEGGTLESLSASSQAVQVEPNGEARVDWRVKVVREGEATVRMKALTDEESDAMEMRFPCRVHGMLKMDSWSGAIRPEEASGRFAVRVPAERRPDQTRLEVRFSPTLAGALVDALPYLADYPYGCTEQTLNRFLPTAIVQKVLIDMGLDLKAIEEKRTNLNAQELGDDRERAKGWKRFERNPVFDAEELRKMVKDGVQRLTEMQLSDGGWGWFSGWGEHSSPHTTATVVRGLWTARQNDVALVPGVIENGLAWLQRYQEGEVEKLRNDLKNPKAAPWKPSADDLDALVFMVLVEAGVKNGAMLDFLYRDRTRISVYSLSMLGISLEKLGEREKLDMALRNISQYLVQDDANQTAWLNMSGGAWWYWYGSEFEAHAYYLKLLARTDPKGGVAPRLVKYLLNNRKHSTYWNSTRDTALCIEALADFLRASGEGKPELTVQLLVDGKLRKAVEITPANLFTFDNKLVLEGEALAAGEHVVELRKEGKGPLYWNGYLTSFTLEEFIPKAGLEIQVNRKYYKLERVGKTEKAAGSRGQAVDQKVEKYERKEVPNLSVLASGDLVEVELEIDSKNDYEYLVFEDMKAAGFEPVDLRSGYTGNALGAYVEYRDDRAVFFARTLARGKHSAAYRLRAEIPGKFSALPAKAWAMYAPELKANSDEIKLGVEDRK